jgi:hypothetical protein
MKQYEIITGPLPPLEAADAVVFTRETIINIAAKHGLHATFSPRVFPHTCNFSAFLPKVQTVELSWRQAVLQRIHTYLYTPHLSLLQRPFVQIPTQTRKQP